MKIKSLEIKINQSTRIPDYTTVDIFVISDLGTKEAHELLPINDFKSKFELMLDTLKGVVLDSISYEDD